MDVKHLVSPVFDGVSSIINLDLGGNIGEDRGEERRGNFVGGEEASVVLEI